MAAGCSAAGRENSVNNGTVRKRIILGFSAVILLMVGLCVFAYVQLQGIEAQASALRAESVPGLDLVGRLHSVSISTYTSVQQLILEKDPARMQQILAYIQEKSARRATRHPETIRAHDKNGQSAGISRRHESGPRALHAGTRRGHPPGYRSQNQDRGRKFAA